jgi:telomere length regulation protein
MMDELLKPAGIVRTTKKETEIDFLRESNAQDHPTGADPKPTPQHNRTPATAEDVLEILKHEPGYDALISALTFLSRHETDRTTFPSIRLPSPLSAQLVQVLVSEITPNYWALLIEDAHQTKNSGLKLLLYCLSSITAVNAILVRLRALTQEAKSEATTKTKRPDISLNLGILLDLLSRVLHGDGWLLEAYRVATSGEDSPARSRPRLQEIVATFGGGRILSLAAEAEEIVKAGGSNKAVADNWPAEPLQYTQWLGRNIVKLMLADLKPEEAKFASDLFAKALRLGHAGKMRRTSCSRPHLTSTRRTDQVPPIRACPQAKG